MKFRTLLYPAAALAAAAIALTPAVAQASAVHGEFTVPGGTGFVQVTIPAVHGQLVHYNVAYAWDNYQHADNLSAASKVSEVDNYTGQNPDTGAKFNGCANTRQPDELFATDVDSYGIPGQQPHTSLHHNAHLTFTPVNNGKTGYHWFLWCHYEHGPETWAVLTFKDGSTVKVYWGTEGTGATYFNEILIVHAGTATTVTPVPADD